MAALQSFLDNLENLQIVISVGLEHIQANRDEFAKNSTKAQVLQAEKLITNIRLLTERLEREFNALEYLLEKIKRSAQGNSE